MVKVSFCGGWWGPGVGVGAKQQGSSPALLGLVGAGCELVGAGSELSPRKGADLRWALPAVSLGASNDGVFNLSMKLKDVF